MIYMVEHGFEGTAEQEAGWNAWYSEHATFAFRSVPGWRSGQRFVAIPPTQPKYRALYTVERPEVMTSPEYRATTGGRFPEAWRNLITGFQRNLGDADWMPAVLEHEALIVVDPPASETDLPGIAIAWMDIVGLDQSVPRRGLAVVPREVGEKVAGSAIQGVGVYAPVFSRWTI